MPTPPPPRYRRRHASRTMNRRTFLATGAGVAAGAMVASPAPYAFPAADKSSVDTDVLVCGGGCAGLAAALASARRGAKTLLIERAGFAGGIVTTVGLPYFDGIADIKDKRVVVRGI